MIRRPPRSTRTDTRFPYTTLFRSEEDAAEEAAAAIAALDDQFGRTTDPVRMYMREMGSVELLDREGEIRIAKRIEEGLNEAMFAMAQYPETVAILLEAYENSKLGQKRLARSEGRRVGKECVSQCNSWWSP